MKYIEIEDICVFNINAESAIYNIEKYINLYTEEEGFILKRVYPKFVHYRFERAEDMWYPKSVLNELYEFKSISHPHMPDEFNLKLLTENEYLLKKMVK